MQKYPELSSREQWQLLLWMARHPVPLLEDTLPAGARLMRWPVSARQRQCRGGLLAIALVVLALALAKRT